jgi:hypothetical protein
MVAHGFDAGHVLGDDLKRRPFALVGDDAVQLDDSILDRHINAYATLNAVP